MYSPNCWECHVQKYIPPEINGVSLSEEFINQFQNKTDMIRNDLNEEDKQRQIIWEEKSMFDTELNNFNELTEEQVKELVFKAPKIFWELDPMPTWMIRDCINEVLPLLTKIVNMSLSLGEMPKDLKE